MRKTFNMEPQKHIHDILRNAFGFRVYTEQPRKSTIGWNKDSIERMAWITLNMKSVSVSEHQLKVLMWDLFIANTYAIIIHVVYTRFHVVYSA